MMRKKAVAMILAIIMAVCGLPEAIWAEEVKVDRRETVWEEEEANEQVGDLTREPGEIVESGSCGENATYTLDAAGMLTISGSGSIGSRAFPYNKNIKKLRIGERITGIGNGAFENCSELTEVEIPAGVTTIGDFAFGDCDGLASIIVDEENTVYDSREGCNAIIETESNELIVGCMETCIPNSVTGIGRYAFLGCSGLEEIEIPSGVTRIGSYAFGNCSKLTKIKIPDRVTSIEAGAFYGCSGLTGIEIPAGITSIGQYSFYHCIGLTGKIKIPSGVTKIEYGAFAWCGRLEEIEIPSGVTSIGDFAFESCSGLRKIEIPSGVTSIGDVAFRGCSGLTEIKIPSGVTTIGDEAFCGCSGLTKIEIPASVTSIGEGVFWGCDDLTIYCYAGSYAETYVKEEGIPYHIIVSSDESPSGPSDGEPIVKPSETPGQKPTDSVQIQDGKNTYEIKDGKTAVYIGTTDRKTKNVKIPDDITVNGKKYPVTAVADKAFQNMNVTGVTLGGSLKSIGESAFAGCRKLKKITIKGNVTKIGKKAFADRKSTRLNSSHAL